MHKAAQNLPQSERLFARRRANSPESAGWVLRACTRLCMHMSVNKGGGGGGSPVCAAERFSTQHFSLMNYTFNQRARRRGEEE